MTGERHYKDRRPTSSSLAMIEASNNLLFESAQKQLREIGPSLKDIVKRIAVEKPDVVVFLDKGARLFRMPIVRYLRETGAGSETSFAAYNDDELKRQYYAEKRYMPGARNRATELITADLGNLKGKKVFFIDETFSTGKGATALFDAADSIGFTAQYFALTKGKWNEMEPDAHFAAAMEAQKQGLIHVYPHRMNLLFSKTAALLYLSDRYDDSRTRTTGTDSRFEFIPPEAVDEAFNYSKDSVHVRHKKGPPIGSRTWSEHDAQVRELNLKTVSLLRREIYETLKGPVNLASK